MSTTTTEPTQPTSTTTDSPFESLYIALRNDDPMRSALFDRTPNVIAGHIPGWSHVAHYIFFRALMHATPVSRMLVLGVFHGRDIAYIQAARASVGNDRTLEVVGVDRFADVPCADWTPDQHGKDWRANGYGTGPATPDQVRQNLDWLQLSCGVKLVQSPDEEYLATTSDTFDCIYIDTSHDYETVARQLRQVKRLCRGPQTIIAGDDYGDGGTWGVKRAVEEAFHTHALSGRIWFSDLARART